MQEHQKRVMDEKSELDGKLDKLNGFFSTDIFKGVDADEQARLKRQAAIMADYSGILGARIAAF